MIDELRAKYPDADNAMLAMLAVRLFLNADAGFDEPSGFFIVEQNGATVYTEITDEAALLAEVAAIVEESLAVGKNLFFERWKPLIYEQGAQY